MRCIFPLFFLICQVQSFTQEELDELFPYFMEKMESRFVPESDFIPVRKKVIDMDALIEAINPMLQHHSGKISTPQSDEEDVNKKKSDFKILSKPITTMSMECKIGHKNKFCSGALYFFLLPLGYQRVNKNSMGGPQGKNLL